MVKTKAILHSSFYSFYSTTFTHLGQKKQAVFFCRNFANFSMFLDFVCLPEKHPLYKKNIFFFGNGTHLFFAKILLDFSWEKDKENRQTPKRSLATTHRETILHTGVHLSIKWRTLMDHHTWNMSKLRKK